MIPDNFPIGQIATLSTTMSEGDLAYLQREVQGDLELIGREETELAYEIARKMHPSTPSLKELLAWDRQPSEPETEPIESPTSTEPRTTMSPSSDV